MTKPDAILIVTNKHQVHGGYSVVLLNKDADSNSLIFEGTHTNVPCPHEIVDEVVAGLKLFFETLYAKQVQMIIIDKLNFLTIATNLS